MKLFENSVGRPSNEIKKKRRIFIASIVMTIVLLVTIGVLILSSHLDESKLKGTPLFTNDSYWSGINSNSYDPQGIFLVSDEKGIPQNEIVMYRDYILTSYDVFPGDVKYISGNSFSFNIYSGKSVKAYKLYVYKDKSKKELIFKDSGKIDKKDLSPDNNVHVTKYTKKISYLNDNHSSLNPEYNDIYIEFVAYNNTSKTEKNKLGTYFFKYGKVSKDKVGIIEKSLNYSKKESKASDLSLKCSVTTLSEGEFSDCTYKIGNYSGKISPNFEILGSTRISAWLLGEPEKGISAAFVAKIDKEGNVTLSLGRPGSKVVTEKLKIKKRNIALDCPSSVGINGYISCKTNHYNDVKISVVSNGKNVSYDFNDEWVDSKKNKYDINRIWILEVFPKQQNVSVTVSKSGRGSVTKTIKVVKYNGKLTLDCSASKVNVNKSVTCKTNMKDVKLSIGDSYDYYKTTSKTLSKNYKFDTPGTYYIKAEKEGYDIVKKKIVVQNPEKVEQTKAPELTLTCPSSSKVNAEFKCSTKDSGVKITVGGAKSLATGYTGTFTTTSKDKTKSIKYASKLFTDYKSIIKKDSNGEYISAKITASKKGYKTATKYVKIYKTSTTSANDAKKANFKVSAVWKGTGKDKKFNIIQGAFGSKVKYVIYVVCETQSECVRYDAWDYMKKKDSSAVTYKLKAKNGDSKVLTLKTADSNEPANKKYYIRRSTYDANEKILYYSVYEITTASKSRKGTAGDVYNTTLKYITGQFY